MYLERWKAIKKLYLKHKKDRSSTDKYKYQNMKIKVSWVGQFTTPKAAFASSALNCPLVLQTYWMFFFAHLPIQQSWIFIFKISFSKVSYLGQLLKTYQTYIRFQKFVTNIQWELYWKNSSMKEKKYWQYTKLSKENKWNWFILFSSPFCSWRSETFNG